MYEERDGKKYKKKEPGSDEEEDAVYFTTRDPFTYTESVRYFSSKDDKKVEEPTDEDFTYEVLTDMANVFPMGYPTE